MTSHYGLEKSSRAGAENEKEHVRTYKIDGPDRHTRLPAGGSEMSVLLVSGIWPIRLDIKSGALLYCAGE
jgi:hypothetical protein